MSQTTALARLSELLQTIEDVGQDLRKQLEQTTTNEGSYAEQIARELSLPFHGDSTTANQASLLRLACERLAHLVTPPRHLVFEAAGSFYTSLALRIILKHDIAKRIHTSENNLPAEGLSEKCDLDADLLARLLRYLSQHGIFQETAPGVFSNTSASLTLVDNPEFKAHLDLVIHEGQLAAPYFEQFLRERWSADKDAAPMSAFALFSRGDPIYKWLHLPENSHRGKNFDLAMRGMGHTEGLGFLPIDYPFDSLPQGTLVVDVGGGIGSLPELLLPTIPHLRFIVQDLESTVSLANEVAGPSMRKWLADGKVKFQVQDCFTKQPKEVEGAVFILKNMIHNYPDPKALQMLSCIRKSNPYKLLVIDRLVTPHLRTEAENEEEESEIYKKLRHGIQDADVDGIIPVSSQGIPTMYDIIMGSLHGGRTRTLTEWKLLLSHGGYRLSKVFPLRASTGQAVLEAIPV